MQDIDSSIAFGRFHMDLTRRTLLADGQPVALHARAFDILEYLIQRRDRPVTRDEIISHVWRGLVVGENNLSVQMSTLRRVLSQYGGDKFVLTVPHRGYQFVDSTLAAAASDTPKVLDVASTQTNLDAPRREGLQLRSRWTIVVVGALSLLAILAWRLAPTQERPSPQTAEVFHPPPHSIAVLAFANMSGDPAQAYFSDGLSEELINLLSGVRQLHVVGRTSSFSFKGGSATIGEIARKLNVGAVLEGSVRRQGSRLRITAALNDATTGYQLWTETFDRDQGDLLQVQTEIATAVMEALRVTLLADQAKKLASGDTDDPKAFDEYLRGVRAQRENTIDSYRAAIAHFDNAAKMDPGFALAYSGRADAMSYLAMIAPHLTAADVQSMFEDALASADRGVALAPDNGLTHAARGYVLSEGLLDLWQGFEELARAQAAAPGNATIQMIYANVAVAVGRIREALAAAHRAVELDPLRQDAWGCLGYILIQARQYAASVDALQHARSVASVFPPQFVSMLGMSLLMLDKPEAARDECALTQEWEGSMCLAFVNHVLGKKDDATAALTKLRSALGDSGAYNYAEIFAQWGQPAEAMIWLKRAVELRDPGLADVIADPFLDPVRSQPGFGDIVSRCCNILHK